MNKSATALPFPNFMPASRRLNWLVGAVATFMMVLLGGIFLAGQYNAPDQSGGAFLQESTTTEVPTILAPTSTPIPTLLLQPMPSPVGTGTPFAEAEDVNPVLEYPTISPDSPDFILGTTYPPITVETPYPNMPRGLSTFDLPDYQTEAIELALDTPVEGTLTTDRSEYVYTYSGKAGDVFVIETTSTTYLNVGYIAQGRPQIGTSTVPDSIPAGGGGGGGGGGSGGDSAPSTVSTNIPVLLSSDSIIWISVGANAVDNDLAYTLTLVSREMPTLVYGKAFTGEMDPIIDRQTMVFEGTRGDVVDIRVESPSDLSLSLETSDGRVIATDDDSGAGRNPELYHVQLPDSGQYTLHLNLNMSLTYSESDFEYSIAVNKVNPMRLDEDVPTGVVFIDKQPFNVLTFNGAAGDTVTLMFDGSNLNGIVSIEVIQNGETLRIADLVPLTQTVGGSGYMPNQLTRTVTLSNDGPVEIFLNMGQLVEPNRGATGAIVVTITK